MAHSQIVLSPNQLQKLRACLVWLGRHASVRCGIVADLSGQDIVHWSMQPNLDTSSIAALAAGNLMATLEIARMFGLGQTGNMITHEHAEQTIIIARINEQLLLLVAASRDTPLGWVRVAVKQVNGAIVKIVGTLERPPAAIEGNFAAGVSQTLDTIW